MERIVAVHGIPQRFVSVNGDPRFRSDFWRALFLQTGTELDFSSAYHPRADGQSKRAYWTIEDLATLLRGYGAFREGSQPSLAQLAQLQQVSFYWLPSCLPSIGHDARTPSTTVLPSVAILWSARLLEE